VDGSFLPTNTINGSVLAVAVQTNNAVIIGGSFSQGTFPSWNARLNADGTTDNSFSSFPNGAVNAIAIQADGKIVIGGAFTTVNGANRFRIARLNTDGSLDNTFQNGLTGASSTVRCVQIQTDGKILIGGDFTTVNNMSRSYVARLNSDGSLDTGFVNSAVGVVGANNSVYAVIQQPNNSVVIGGAFTTYSSTSISHVARLYADGTRDTTFTNFGINNTVQALVRIAVILLAHVLHPVCRFAEEIICIDILLPQLDLGPGHRHVDHAHAIILREIRHHRPAKKIHRAHVVFRAVDGRRCDIPIAHLSVQPGIVHCRQHLETRVNLLVLCLRPRAGFHIRLAEAKVDVKFRIWLLGLGECRRRGEKHDDRKDGAHFYFHGKKLAKGRLV
jgi:uncharacterized delta-60 repeat protein